MKKYLAALGAVVLAAFSINAQAATIDFQALETGSNGFAIHGSTYSEDGYTLNTGGQHGFASWQTGNSNFQGSTALFNDTQNATTELVQSDGGIVNLFSIDLASVDTGSKLNVKMRMRSINNVRGL